VPSELRPNERRTRIISKRSTVVDIETRIFYAQIAASHSKCSTSSASLESRSDDQVSRIRLRCRGHALRVAGQSARAPVPGYRSTETHGANERGERPNVIPLAPAKA
jgi:hypothetical protein